MSVEFDIFVLQVDLGILTVATFLYSAALWRLWRRFDRLNDTLPQTILNTVAEAKSRFMFRDGM